MSAKLISKRELVKLVQVCERTIDNLVAAGKIPSVRIGNRRLYDPEDVVAALKAGSADPRSEVESEAA